MKDRFHELLAANGPALWRLTAGYARTHSDREDLFQEIALAIWKALPGFRELSSERTFIFYPESDKNFFAKVLDAQITFETDRRGRATGLIFRQGGTSRRVPRID